MTEIATSLITDDEREYLTLKNRANTAADDGTYDWALNEIERLREAANDLAQYVSRADWYHYVKPETRAALREKE